MLIQVRFCASRMRKKYSFFVFGEKYKNLDEMDRKLDDKVIEEIFRLDTKEISDI